MTIIISKINYVNVDIFDFSAYFDIKRNIKGFFKAKMDDLYEGRLNF